MIDQIIYVLFINEIVCALYFGWHDSDVKWWVWFCLSAGKIVLLTLNQSGNPAPLNKWMSYLFVNGLQVAWMIFPVNCHQQVWIEEDYLIYPLVFDDYVYVTDSKFSYICYIDTNLYTKYNTAKGQLIKRKCAL